MDNKRTSNRLLKVESALVPDPTTTPASVLVPWVLTHLNSKLDWLDYFCRMNDATLEILVKELYRQKAIPPIDFSKMSDAELDKIVGFHAADHAKYHPYS